MADHHGSAVWKFQQNRLFEDIAKRHILRRGKVVLSEVYEKHYVREHASRQNAGDPISSQTFYRWVSTKIHPDVLIAAQQGRVAAKEAKTALTGRVEHTQFMNEVQCDARYNPIALLNPLSLRPSGVRPVTYSGIETKTTVAMGEFIDYENNAESSAGVIELLKLMLLPTPNLHIEIGLGNEYKRYGYGKPTEVRLDSGKANTAAKIDDFLKLATCGSSYTRTRDSKGNGLIEGWHARHKSEFLSHLPGAYDDTQQSNIDPKHWTKFAVLTNLEHKILSDRYWLRYNYSFSKQRNFYLHEQWALESDFAEPSLPPNPKLILDFPGTPHLRKIIPKVGIVIQLNHQIRVFNSDELQEFRRIRTSQLSQSDEQRVQVIASPMRSTVSVYCSKLNRGIEHVPLIAAPDYETFFEGSNQFYRQLVAENLEIDLASMTDQQIIDYAHNRDAMIKRYLTKQKQKGKQRAIRLEDMRNSQEAEVSRLLPYSDKPLIQSHETDPELEQIEEHEEKEESEPQNQSTERPDWSSRANPFNKKGR
ncbi:hypothetical protein GCM10011369_18790 [Neiella marina]|uniref:Uncharacterized protein n=1 Tax=Neiella marina TaxID=508461 RepID=A0A8J2XP44_9GAMM|nr:hypothetical protein [Neiella marina]GGA77179.1 hypothetical protein GCM10011369_18790 [Neiella marina]